MSTIAETKAALEKWTPIYLFNVILKDGVPRYWAKQALTYAGNAYQALVLEHSELKVEGNGVYGVDAVAQIGLTLNNADANLNSLITPSNWQGGLLQPFFIFVAPDGTTTTDAIVFPKFLFDLPSATWPKIEVSAHNKFNLARKMLPASLVTKKDRYPFPDTDAERAAAGSNPASEFFASGYDPDTGKGNMNGGAYYRRHEYDGTREMLKTIGLEVRFGGFGKVPPTVVGTPKKGEKSDYTGNANEAKYGQAVPLVFGTCRIQPIVLDTGFPSGEGGWNGARLSHYLLSDGVSFGPEASMGIEDVLDVFIPDNKKYQRIPETSNEPSVTGAWSFQGGYYGSQKAPASSKYRNIDSATDFPDPLGDFIARDLYSGLAYLEIGFPKELSGVDGIGPKLEAIVKGLKIETWDSGGSSTWQWTDNPVWVFVHLLKLLRWTTDDMDKPTIAAAAAHCDEVIGSGKPRFRCNLALMNQTRAADVLRGVRNNCRMYTSFAADGKLQLRIARNVAGEGGLAFTLDSTTIMRGDDGELKVEKFHRSIFETANVFSSTFQNEENAYNSDSVTMTDVRNVNQIDERVSADSIFPMLGIPSYDQAERQLEWARQEQVTLNEYYRVTASFALIEAKVGQVGTITEPRHALIGQQVRIRAMAPGPDAGTVELVLQKHSDGAYTDQSVETPFTRAQADSSYTPRSVGGKFAASPAPVLTEVIVAGPTGLAVRRIKVEFKPPSRDYEGSFSRETKISDVVVATSGGTIPGDQVLFVEVAPVLDGVRGLASEYLMAVVPSGGNANTISLTCELPPEADQYILFVGNFPGQTYEQAVEPSPGTAPFTITVTGLFRNFGSIPPDPAYDHASIFYKYNSSPNVLRDGGRTFSPTETTLEFEPEFPAGNDTQVTVYVSSTNAAEDDFYPIEISPKATLTLTQESGKAMDWEASLLPGPTPSSVVPRFTRPKINGKRLFWVSGQIKDSSVGVWRETDENAGASVVYYDGSAISHESIGGIKIKKDPGQPLGFGTANLDDLMLLDVAGGSFDVDRCQWGTVEQFLDDLGAPTTAANARYIALTGGLFRPQTTQDLRMKIVKPHHTWDTEGYLGSPDGAGVNGFNGIFWEEIIGREGNEFILKPVEIGRELSSVDVRFWIENDYCRSGNAMTVSTDEVAVHSGRDDVLPGQPQDFVVNPVGPEFRGTWKDPLTGAGTIDDYVVQHAADAAFTAPVTSGGLGPVNHAEGYDPGKTYWFRVAARNQSGLANHPDTAFMEFMGWGTTGWGPWSAVVGPVTTSASTGPTDSVLPGLLVSLSVTGGNGNFVADWKKPATGNLTIDDHAIQYADNPGFTINPVKSSGWGPATHQQSTKPGSTHYFRIAAHNQSGLDSHASIVGLGYEKGWGPWTNYGAPNAVSSGPAPGTPGGTPADSVIPSAVLSLSVTGGNGKFIAKWLDPATGNQTIDDMAISWSINSSFSPEAANSPAAGWGKRNLLESESPSCIFWFRVAVHNQSNQPSHATTAALGATGWGPWAAYGAAVSSGEIAIGDNTIPPAKFTGAARTEFIETFDIPINSPPWIFTGSGAAGRSYPLQGIDGARVLQAGGGFQAYSTSILIPYDPRKLYRISARIRHTLISDTTKALVIVGVVCLDANQAQIGNVYAAASYKSTYPEWLPSGGWHEVSGWFKGATGTVFQEAPDPANPTSTPNGTNWISPIFALNWDAGNLGNATGGNVMQIDDFRIEAVSERGEIPSDSLSPPVQAALGDEVDNMLENGGGEEGIAGQSPTGWPLGAGFGGKIDYSIQKFGSRSIKLSNPTPNYSSLGQAIALEAGVIYEVSGWIKTGAQALSGAHYGPVIWVQIVSGIGSFTILEKVVKGADPDPAQVITGIQWNGAAHDFTFVRCRFAPTSAGQVNVLLVSNLGLQNETSTSWFDGVKLARMWQWNTPDLRDTIITTAKLVNDAVTEVKIATSAITTTKIANDSVTTPKLVALNVTAAKIAALAITADKINVATLSAITVNAGEITAGIITGLLIRTGVSSPRVELSSSGFRSYGSDGVEYYTVAPQTIGTKVYGYEWRLHPNLPAGTSMVFAGHTNKTSNLLFQTADGTELGNRAYSFLVHGGGTVGYISFGTINTERMRISEIGIGLAGRLEMTNFADPASTSGLTLYSYGAGYLSWRGQTDPVGGAQVNNCSVAVRINGRYIYLNAFQP